MLTLKKFAANIQNIYFGSRQKWNVHCLSNPTDYRHLLVTRRMIKSCQNMYHLWIANSMIHCKQQFQTLYHDWSLHLIPGHLSLACFWNKASNYSWIRDNLDLGTVIFNLKDFVHPYFLNSNNTVQTILLIVGITMRKGTICCTASETHCCDKEKRENRRAEKRECPNLTESSLLFIKATIALSSARVWWPGATVPGIPGGQLSRRWFFWTASPGSSGGAADAERCGFHGLGWC